MLKKAAPFFRKQIVLFFILALVVLMAFASPAFFSFPTLINILSQISIYGVAACAMTIAIICGDFDLSISSIFPLGTVLFAMFVPTMGVWPAMLLTVLAGCLIGCINGFFVSVMRINAFIVTLSTMIAIKGFALTISDGKPISMVNEATHQLANGSLFGILPYIMLIFFACVAITELVLKRTPFGRNIYAVGGNYEVAKFAGINVRLYKFIIFVILGGAAAFAGTLLASRLQAGSPIYGADIGLSVVSATVVGGTSLSGGRGGAVKTFVGLLFIGLLYQVFSFINVQLYFQDVIKGSVIILVVIIDAVNTRRSARAVRS